MLRKGGKAMERRKVVKIGNALYVNIPSDVSAPMGIGEGDYLYVFHVIGTGILVTKASRLKKVSLNPRAIGRINRILDFVYSL
jgi:antitoxin component of MazEF toxin-antitoxin module